MRKLDIAPLPPLIIWEPTLACNFRCKFCGFYGPGGAKPDLKKEMTSQEQWEMWESILDSYKLYKPHVGITGGEPFLNLNKNILLSFKSRKISWSITTNGYLLTDNKVQDLIFYGCDEIRISIHGPKDVHDKTVNIKGAFDKVIKNIKNAKKHPIDILINCVITNDNVDSLYYMKGLARDLGVKIRFQHLEFLTTKMKEAHKKFTKINFGGDFPVKFGTTTLSKDSINKLESFLESNVNIEQEPKPWMGQFLIWDKKDVSAFINLYYRTFTPNSNYCFQPWGTARIDPYGNVYPCIDYFFDNLQESSFKGTWNGIRARHFRKTLKENKLFPGCARCCKL